jgi:hypothetical protein
LVVVVVVAVIVVVGVVYSLYELLLAVPPGSKRRRTTMTMMRLVGRSSCYVSTHAKKYGACESGVFHNAHPRKWCFL